MRQASWRDSNGHPCLGKPRAEESCAPLFLERCGSGRLNPDILLVPPSDHAFWFVPAFLLGACIGSFLNVVIHRLPRGLSVRDPRRSICPHCGAPIPFRHNLPLVSWCLLRGRCRACGGRISARYLAVELITALLFVAVWALFPPVAVPFLWVLAALLVALTFIDAGHLIIPTRLTWVGALVGLAACAVWPQLPVLAGAAGDWTDGLRDGAIGWAAGFFGLWGVVELGKLAFGKKQDHFDPAVDWRIEEPADEREPLCFIIGDDRIDWWDLFTRKRDRLVIESEELLVDGVAVAPGTLTIRRDAVELPDGTCRDLADLTSLAGRARAVVIPREAMGFGDVHLLGMIGAFFGWPGVFFSLFAGSMLALAWAVAGRIGFGRQLPFGPFLAMGSLCWSFGGWRLWAWYLELLGPLWMR